MRRSQDPQVSALAALALERHPAAVARLLEEVPADESLAFLERQPVARLSSLVRWLTPDFAAGLFATMRDDAAAALLRALDPNRAAALLARLDESHRVARLQRLPPRLAEELRALMAYPAGTAGALMDPRVMAFGPGATVRGVIKHLRTLRHKRIQDLFLVDDEMRLLGAVPLQEVVLARGEAPLHTLMQRGTPSVPATSSREEVMAVLESHRVASLPVVDFDGRLLGVLRQHELMAAVEHEAAADMLTMVGASKEERALSGPLFAVRKRLPWLQVNLLTAFLAAAVVGIFEETIARVTVLAVLLPVAAGQSGNTGAQALAVTMRGLALREIRVRHWIRVAGKELAVGAISGLAVALTTAVAVYFWSGSKALCAVIAISMVVSMTAAALCGALIPMALTVLRQDPAQSSSIILTTVTDVVAFLSFLGVATLFLSHLPT